MNDPRLERLRDAALKLADIFPRPDESMMEFMEPEHRAAMHAYWDAVDQLQPLDATGKPPTQYLRPKVVGMDARALKPKAE